MGVEDVVEEEGLLVIRKTVTDLGNVEIRIAQITLEGDETIILITKELVALEDAVELNNLTGQNYTLLKAYINLFIHKKGIKNFIEKSKLDKNQLPRSKPNVIKLRV